ncbi:mast cell-expressed membrane protein 1 isoform X1 [Diceros bicornis minor]|uniref:mast cell-expressed membrane protein 1 isoform X1 n=1 Tax=Diceros bicornis minor TaxID=77932 RepID=UPI0026EC65CB|nr:mast cell-expressed membrane protein 1 isoform X1 [Diceros bicornis minor]
MNQEVKMQVAAFKEKRGSSASKEGASDPNYENITLTFRNRDQPKGSRSPPKTQVPAWSRPPSESAQVPHWLHRAMMSLYILLALVCITLLALTLVKNSEMSQKLLDLKTELQNVSILVQQCQEEQKLGCTEVLKHVKETKGHVDQMKSSVQKWNEILQKLSADMKNIQHAVQKISNELKPPKQQPTPSE